MLETLIIAAAASLLAPIARSICEGNDETPREDTSGPTTDSSCDHAYGEHGTERASGDRQTTLGEYGD